MLRRVAILLAAACLITIVQPSGAYEIKPCDGFKGEIISVEVHNCPNKTAEFCEIGQKDILSYDIKFKAGTTFKDVAWTGWEWGRNGIITAQENFCEIQPDFCPGKEGDELHIHFENDLKYGFLPSTGVAMPLKLFSRLEEGLRTDDHYIVCVKVMTKFH